MRGVQSIWPTGQERWRTPAIVAASVALHALVLGYISFRSLDLDVGVFDPGPTIIELQIEPRPLLPGEVARVPAPPDRPMDQPRLLSVPGSPSAETRIFRDPRDDEDTPLSPSPRPGATGAPAPPADVGTAPWRVRPEALGDRVARGLRTGTVGCASPSLLTARERALCEDRFGERAAAAPPIEGTGNPERDARFAAEGRRAIAEYEARRRPLSGGSGIIGPGDCPGSNFGIGCAGAYLQPEMRQGATTTHNPSQARPLRPAD